jgi:uncharacterized protein YegJ (DUF2314 family)
MKRLIYAAVTAVCAVMIVAAAQTADASSITSSYQDTTSGTRTVSMGTMAPDHQLSVAAATGYTLTNINGGKCLEIAFGGVSDFNVASQYTCYGGTVQQWTLTYMAYNTYMLTNVNSGKCLEIGFSGVSDFNVANQYTCYGGTAQQWHFTNVSSNIWTLTNVNSGKCLEIGFGGVSDFNVADQYTCYGGTAQQWRLI